jgi:hypothetical protein
MRRICLVVALMGSSVASAQIPDSLPFGSGELLTYGVRASKFGKVGNAVMSVTGPVVIRGTETMRVAFDTHLGVMFLKGGDQTRSWIDPLRMTSLRFEKHERRPFSSDDDSVEIYPDLRYWSGTHGDSGTTMSPVPLDELSFIYFLRTVSLLPDSVYAFDRHYDKRRVPTTVRFVKRETLLTPAGKFNTVELEMRSKDGVDYKDEWVLHLWISEDRCRLPVRMESTVPILGKGVLTLETAITPTCDAAIASARDRAAARP